MMAGLTVQEMLLWIGLITLGGIFGQFLYELPENIRNRKKRNLECDKCGKFRVLRRTKDKAYWACVRCRKEYHKALRGNE